MRSLVGERDERAARAATNALNEQISHRITMIQSVTLRAAQATESEDFLSIADDLEFFATDFNQGLAIFNSSFDLLYFTGDESFWLDRQLTADLLSKYTMQTPGKVGIYTFRGLSEANPVVILLAADSEHRLISAGAFSPADTIEYVMGDVFSPSEGGYAFVVDGDRQVLFQTGEQPDQSEDLGNHIGVSEAQEGKTGSTYLELSGKEHVVAYSPVETAGWVLIIEEPWDVVASPLLRLTEYAPLVLIPILLLTLLALWFGTRRIVEPLRHLEERASALGWGDYDSIEVSVGGIAEIRSLQNELIQLSKKVKLAQQGLRGFIRSMTSGLEEEKHRLARELHDDTLQSLIALNQRIQLARLSTGDTTIEQNLEELQKITENTIKDLRRTTRALRPIYLEDLGFSAALDMLRRETEQIHGIVVHYQREGNERRLPGEAELALYRMVQEALNNIARHADAEEISIHVYFSDTNLTVEVTDDGLGFNVPDSPSEFAPGGHYGLLGMYERAELIGAKLSINSEAGKGTQITISLPIRKESSGKPEQS